MGNGTLIARFLPHKCGHPPTAESVNRRAESVKMLENEAKNALVEIISGLQELRRPLPEPLFEHARKSAGILIPNLGSHLGYRAIGAVFQKFPGLAKPYLLDVLERRQPCQPFELSQ